MAKIIYKKKYKPYISQTISALIIIAAILISYSSIEMIYKIIWYAILFILNYKFVIKIDEGIRFTSK